MSQTTNATTVSLIIVGAKGKMGQMLIQCAAETTHLKVVKGVDFDNPSVEPEIASTQALIDFSHHDSIHKYLPAVIKNNVALVIGTTGHTAEEKKMIQDASTKIPLVFASNYSTGMNTMFYLIRRAAEILGPDYDQEVIEMHHRHKKDAPSGSALSLAQVLADVKKETLEKLARHGREGMVGARTQSEIGIHALRGGDIVGDHTVLFSAMGETVSVSHRATSRQTFARGALRAAEWAVGQKPGLYDMMDVLGLK